LKYLAQHRDLVVGLRHPNLHIEIARADPFARR
jgi:hypothetical protein